MRCPRSAFLVLGNGLLVFSALLAGQSRAADRITLEVAGREMTITTADAEIDLSVANQGRGVRIDDRRLGLSIYLAGALFDPDDFQAAKRLRLRGYAVSLAGKKKPQVEIRRRGPAPRPKRSPPRPAGKRRGVKPKAAIPQGSTTPKKNVQPPARKTASTEAGFGVGEIRQLVRHQGPITSLAFSPDGRLALSADGGTVRIWDLATGKEVRRLGERSGDAAVAVWSPDGRRVAAGGTARRIRIWDAKTGELLKELRQEGWIQALAYSPDGAYLLSGGHHLGGTRSPSSNVRLWAVDSEVSRLLELPLDCVWHIEFSPDGSQALCAGGYASNSDTPLGPLLRVWDVKTDETRFEFAPPLRTLLWSAAFSPDGRLVLAREILGSNGLVAWNLATGERVRRFPGHTGFNVLAVSADGRYVLTGSADGGLSLSTLPDGRHVASWKGNDQMVQAVALSPDGRRALSGGRSGVIRLWSLSAGASAETRRPRKSIELLQRHRFQQKPYAYAVAFTPDGSRLVSTGFDHMMRVWDVDSGKPLAQLGDGKLLATTDCLAVAPDGKSVLVGEGLSYGSQRLSLWDLDAKREIRQVSDFAGYPTCLACSPDGRLALMGTSEGKVLLWDFLGARQVADFQMPFRLIRCVSFSPDGRLAAITGGTNKNQVRVIQLDGGHLVHQIEGHLRGPFHRALFLSGSRLIVVRSGKELGVWDIATHRQRYTSIAQAPITDLALSGDRRYALTGDTEGNVCLWEAETGRLLDSVGGHAARVTSVAFSPRGRYAASAGYDATVRIWSLKRP